MLNSYKDLIVWRRGIDLAKTIYKLTDRFPPHEQFGLISQMRRSAVSIPSNIAEGSARGTRKDYGQFLRIAYGSSAELETQIELGKQLGFGSNEDYYEADRQLNEIRRMLNVLISKISLKPKT